MNPLFQQHAAIKSQYPDVLLMFRVGDFYELFGPDAEHAARVLNLTLMSRDNGEEQVPMCGVPHHAVEKDLARLIAAGFRVALCDQVEDPRSDSWKTAQRKVTRVVTSEREAGS